MTFQDALAATRGMRAVARPKVKPLREGIGWRLDGDRVVWFDRTAIVDFAQYAQPHDPPTYAQLVGEWEVVGV